MDKYIEYLGKYNTICENKYNYYSELRDVTKKVYNRCLNYHKVYPYTSSKYGDVGYNPCRPFLNEIKHSDERIEYYSKIISDNNYKLEQYNLIENSMVKK